MGMKEIIAKHEADKNIEALNAIKAETGLDSATVNLAEQAIARINEINKKATEVLETTPSEISQIKNLGGDIGNKSALGFMDRGVGESGFKSGLGLAHER